MQGVRVVKGALTLYDSGSASESVNEYKIHKPERDTEITQSNPFIPEIHSFLHQSFNVYSLNRYPWATIGRVTCFRLLPVRQRPASHNLETLGTLLYLCNKMF